MDILRNTKINTYEKYMVLYAFACTGIWVTPAVASAATGVLSSLTSTQAKLNGGTKTSSLASKKSFVE